MKRKVISCAAALAFCGLSTGAQAALGDLTNTTFVSYGDGQSFSLPIAQLACENNIGGAFGGIDCGTYRVASTPGAIKDLVVIATGAEGAPVTTNVAGFDSAFSTPSGVSGSRSFATTPTTSRGEDATIANNNVNTWDASLAALQTFLGAGWSPIFFFNNNQVNSGASTNQNLAAWARMWITDAAGAIVDIDQVTAGVQQSLTFANRTPPIAANNCLGGAGAPSPYAIVGTTIPPSGGCPSVVESDNVFEFNQNGAPGAGPEIGNNSATDFVLSGGAICLNAAFAPQVCDGTQAFGPINHNLGADEVAYAVIFPELNATLNALFGPGGPLNLGQYTFHLDFRMGCTLTEGDPICTGRDLNNGYEQLFLGTAQQTTIFVPEPGTLALLGAMLGVFPLVRRAWATRK